MVNGGAVWGGDEIYLNQEKAYLRLGMSNGIRQYAVIGGAVLGV